MKTVATLAALAALANAHATWQQLWQNGKDLESTCARLPTTNSPVEDYTSNALQCMSAVYLAPFHTHMSHRQCQAFPCQGQVRLRSW